MDLTMTSVVAIIPHYQKEAGLLSRAVNSVLKQTCAEKISIIISDDESPIPALDDLKANGIEQNDKIRVIRNQNGGAGPARNRALDIVPDGTDYVAFLDSDDVWMPGHIETAIKALEYGYDFYFSDYMACDHRDTSNFVRIGSIKTEEHELLESKLHIYAFKHTALDHIIRRGNVIQTSTAMYRFAKFSKLRFREEFYNGQDFFFWMDIEQLGATFVFSTNVECDCGLGFNIYSGAGWGTRRSLQRTKNELKIWSSAEKIYPMNQLQKKSNKAKLAGLQKIVVQDIIHRIIRRKPVDMKILSDIVKLQPMFLVNAPFFFLNIMINKLLSR